MTVVTNVLAVLRRLAIVIAIAIAFLFGLATTVYLSLRSPEVKVPEVVGKDRFVAENELKTAGLNFRVRAARASNQVKADTVMFQLPHAGEVVKEGQTVAVDVSRTAKEGEASETIATEDKSGAAKTSANANASASGNLNENKPKRNKNANANRNANGNANGNRNANANRANAKAKANANNGNVNSVSTRPNNTNRSAQPDNANSNRANRNINRPAPAVAPTPPGRR